MPNSAGNGACDCAWCTGADLDNWQERLVATGFSTLSIDTLTPLLGSVARLVSRNAQLSRVELRTLLLGVDVEPVTDAAILELERWRLLLETLRDQPSIDLINATTEAMQLRGISSGAIRSAVSTIVGYDITTHGTTVDQPRQPHGNGTTPLSAQEVACRLAAVATPRLSPWDALQLALAQDDDDALVAAWHPSLATDPRLGTAQQHRVEQALRRTEALAHWREAVATGDEHAIVAAWDHRLHGYDKVQPGERTLLRLAQWAISLPDHVRQTLTAPGPWETAEEDDATVVIGTDAVAETELAREPALAALRAALDAGDGGRALEIERQALVVSDDARLLDAKRALLAMHEPADLDARLVGTQLWAQWRWPTVPLIDAVTVCWRDDRLPESPFELGTQSRVMVRHDYEQSGAFQEAVGHQELLHVRVFSALRRDPTRDDADNWLVSPGEKEDAASVARHQRAVRCRLTKKPGANKNWLEITSTDRSPLPELVIVRREGGLPLRVAEGDIIAHVDATSAAKPWRALVALDVASWPARSVVRVFPANPEDGRWVTIEGVRLDVN
jgi:hypothetical protein